MEKLLFFGLGLAVSLLVHLVVFIVKAKGTFFSLVNSVDDLTHVIDQVQDNYDRKLNRVEEGLTREIQNLYRNFDNFDNPNSQKKKAK